MVIPDGRERFGRWGSHVLKDICEVTGHFLMFNTLLQNQRYRNDWFLPLQQQYQGCAFQLRLWAHAWECKITGLGRAEVQQKTEARNILGATSLVSLFQAEGAEAHPGAASVAQPFCVVRDHVGVLRAGLEYKEERPKGGFLGKGYWLCLLLVPEFCSNAECICGEECPIRDYIFGILSVILVCLPP